MPEAVADPLHRFPVFRTSNPEELRQLAAKLFGAAQIDLGSLDNFEARVNLIQMQETGLAFGATSVDLTITVLRRTSSGCKSRAGAARPFPRVAKRPTSTIASLRLRPPALRSRNVCEAGHECLMLRLNVPALLQRLTALLGAKPKGEMTFEAAIEAGQPHAQVFPDLILFFLSQQLDLAAAPLARRRMP